MSQSPYVGSVTPTLRAKDSCAMKLGVPLRTLWSKDQDPVLLVVRFFILLIRTFFVPNRAKIWALGRLFCKGLLPFFITRL